MSEQADQSSWHAVRPLNAQLRRVRIAVIAVTLLCAVAQIALAAQAMLILDVALPGRNGETLVGIVAMALVTLVLLVGGVTLRQRLLAQAGRMIAFRLAPVTAARRFDIAETEDGGIDGRDMERVRLVLANGGLGALAELTALPLFLVVMLMLGWPMAVALLIGCALAVALLLLWARDSEVKVATADRARDERDELLRDHAASRMVIRELGLFGPMRVREEYAELAAIDPIDSLDSVAGRNRLIMAALAAALILAIGALTVWRATDDRAGVGTIAAALILTGFAVWPMREVAARQIELARARLAWRRLRELLDAPPARSELLPLPTPSQTLAAEAIAIGAPGERRVVLQGVTFALAAGDAALIVGPANSGKSMLLRALAGLARNSIGTVRLDGATLAQYGEAGRARHIGYLSHACPLLPGTISQNIAGFAEAVDPAAVVRAAQATGAHDIIVRLPQGYDTIVGGPDCSLPQSTRQRVALTAAFFGDPFLLLLDTPDSFQDRQGQIALGDAIRSARARGAIVLVTAESAAVIDAANIVVVVRKGGIADFGPKEDVRERMLTRERLKNQPKPDAAVPAASAE